ncbi:MAG: thiamine diphosphokinase [Clostridia bacterium]|nr:thiamine diphosphokinase [Clostridia bacterium]
MSHHYCCIVSAGTFEPGSFAVEENAYLIAADGGYAYLQTMNIMPDMVIGDFDSLEYIPTMPSDDRIISLEREKDDTDTLYAVKHALRLGYDRFLIFGALGGSRVDHTVANLQTLSYIANHNAQGFIISNDTVITAITNSKLRFNNNCKGIISVFSASGESSGVTIRGLKYTLTDGILSSDMPLGVSNEFIGQNAEIEVKNGTLLIMFEGSYKDCTD